MASLYLQDYISLVKIPLLLWSTRLALLALTPPNPPPAAEETAKFGSKDILGHPFLVRVVPLFYKNIYYIVALSEPAVLLASQFPSQTSDVVIRVLAHDSAVLASKVRFTSPWLAGCLLLACGSLLRLACYRELGKFFTWELSIKKDQRLVTTGPYSVVRHPSYAASALMGLGTVLMHFAPGGWYAECVGYTSWASKLFAFMWSAWELMLPLALMTRVEKEDSVLREKFGGEWDAWRRQTPYRVVPLVY